MSTIAVGLLFVLLALAVGHDIRFRRIPNWLNFSGMAAGLAVSFALGGTAGLKESVLGWGFIAAVAGFFWSAGMIGGGDHKLLMVVGSFIGLTRAIPTLAAIAIFGGVQALGWVLYLRARRPTTSFRTLLRTTRIAYSLAIAGGTIYTILIQ